MPIVTSKFLRDQNVYSRAELREAFSIIDASLNNGIFHPKNHNSVWLFVTQEKTSDRVQYADFLDGDILHFAGQTSGRADPMIIDHAAKGDELLLFYRNRKYEYPGASFRYEGRFEYVDHVEGSPSAFTLHRLR